MKVAALDLGSNSFLCLIAEVSHAGIGQVYSDHVEIVRLGQGLNLTKKFSRDALQRAEQCLAKFSRIINEHKPDKILAMATSAARDATNKEELFYIAKKYNIPIEIISGDLEASITYQGAISGNIIENSNENQNLMVVDVGGGSTEFIFGQGQNILKCHSRNIGCVRLTEQFITSQPTPEHEITLARDFIDEQIKKTKLDLSQDLWPKNIVAVAGTPTTLAAVELGAFDVTKINEYKLDHQKLKNWFDKLKNATICEKITMGIPEGRADVILIGVMILLRTLELFELDHMTVSTRGVRYGIALELGRRFLSKH